MRRKISKLRYIAKGLWLLDRAESGFIGTSHNRLAVFFVCCALCIGGCATTEKTTHEPSALAPGVPPSKQAILWHDQYPVDESSIQALDSPLVPARGDNNDLSVPRRNGVQIIDIERGKVLSDHALTDSGLDTLHIASVGVFGDERYVASLDGDVFALAAKDGHEIWRQDLSGELLSQPAISDREIVYHTGDGRLVCLDRATGQNLWVFRETPPSLTLRGTAAPVISGNRVLAGFADGHLVALDLAPGSVIWDTVIGEPKGHSVLSRMTDVDAGLLVAGDLVYATAYQGRTAAVSRTSGRVVWSRDVSTYTGMSIWQDHLFMTGTEGEVWAFDRNTGEILWRQDALMYRRLSAPVAFENGVYVIDFEGYLHRISAQDGHLVSRMKVASESEITPILMRVADKLLVADSEGGLWLLDTGGAV